MSKQMTCKVCGGAVRVSRFSGELVHVEHGPAQQFPNTHDVPQRTRGEKRFWIYRVDENTGARTRVGSGSKTTAKALDLRARMRAQQPLGSSTWFTLPVLEPAAR